MKKKNKTRKVRIQICIFSTMILLGCAALYFLATNELFGYEKPENLLVEYMQYIEKQEYEAMYSMLDSQSAESIELDDYVKRNSNIYEGIEACNLQIQNVQVTKQEGKRITLTYQTSLDTVAGEIVFDNHAAFVKEKKGYKLIWDDSLIFPQLENTDKVTVSVLQAERGEILDRNGYVLAGKGVASAVGIVPGKWNQQEKYIKKLAGLLDVDTKIIKNKLQAEWVQADSFVPIKTIPKAADIVSMDGVSDETIDQALALQEQLLSIPGVMISDEEVRSYGMGEAAAHLMGYVQGVTAEDLEEHQGEGYTSNSVIGRGGMEGLFEKELKGKDGCEISIVNEEGKIKECLASVERKNGKEIQLTIDASLQQLLYDQFQDDPGCSAALNPYTGEVLALVSTPSYDNNAFIMGMSDKQWTSLNEDEKNPLYNRFRQIWCPGSTFKPLIAAVGLKTDSIDPDEDFGNVGLSWQKDESWGDYYVTTLHECEPVTMENALIYSDNIYFAKTALKIGADNLEQSLKEMGFHQELPFEIKMTNSQYSNSETIETEIQLADSGYGQGQVLVNPLHLASLYTAFLNHGNIIKPHLLKEKADSEIWIPEMFSEEDADRVLEGLKKVVNNPNGTGYAAHREDMILAGKTGTAEIKASKEDTTGTEIGWFSVFTAEENAQNPILIVSMVEDVKEYGGSGYVVQKDKNVLDSYLQ